MPEEYFKGGKRGDLESGRNAVPGRRGYSINVSKGPRHVGWRWVMVNRFKWKASQAGFLCGEGRTWPLPHYVLLTVNLQKTS